MENKGIFPLQEPREQDFMYGVQQRLQEAIQGKDEEQSRAAFLRETDGWIEKYKDVLKTEIFSFAEPNPSTAQLRRKEFEDEMGDTDPCLRQRMLERIDERIRETGFDTDMLEWKELNLAQRVVQLYAELDVGVFKFYKVPKMHPIDEPDTIAVRTVTGVKKSGLVAEFATIYMDRKDDWRQWVRGIKSVTESYLAQRYADPPVEFDQFGDELKYYIYSCSHTNERVDAGMTGTDPRNNTVSSLSAKGRRGGLTYVRLGDGVPNKLASESDLQELRQLIAEEKALGRRVEVFVWHDEQVRTVEEAKKEWRRMEELERGKKRKREEERLGRQDE